MITLKNNGILIKNGKEIIEKAESTDIEQAKKNTIAYSILSMHNTSGNDKKLKIKFDAMASHDITYVGIIQTAKLGNLKEFPIPYVLTNCHNSLCAVGGTINEDDHIFGLSAAKHYGGIYVPAHQSVIHSYMREEMAGCGKMILGSDSHTRYGALGTMAIGEGGPELVKQLFGRTYDVDMPEIIAVYLKGKVRKGVGPHDVALALIGAVYSNNFVKNKILEFVGDGISGLSQEFRNGIDVMTTESACLSSIWMTDEKTEKYLEDHNRKSEYKKLSPNGIAYYSGMVEIDLDKIEPMIALPHHPSNTYTIKTLLENASDILTPLGLADKITDRGIRVDQGVIAGCAGGIYDNLCASAAILKDKSIGNGGFALSVYPASQPVFEAIIKNGVAFDLMHSGATLRTAFCGPCFGAGDVPSNGSFSIRHTTRNFPNREGSKPADGQSAYVALMDSRSIAATAANGGYLTSAFDVDYEDAIPDYEYDDTVYRKRVYNGWGKADKNTELQYGPNITDWPAMQPLDDNLLLSVASYITDDVTTTDELIPSGDSSSYRSNPIKLSQLTLSRKDPGYVVRAKAGNTPFDSLDDCIKKAVSSVANGNIGVGSLIFAKKPGDGSAREQAASCQRVLGGRANIALEYATKRYRSNLINWGMLPLLTDGMPECEIGDYILLKDIKQKISNADYSIDAFIIKPNGDIKAKKLTIAPLTDEEREIIIQGCLINYYNKESK